MVHYAQNARPRTISKEKMLADFDEAKKLFLRYIVQYWETPASNKDFAKGAALAAINQFEAEATAIPGKELARTLRAML